MGVPFRLQSDGQAVRDERRNAVGRDEHQSDGAEIGRLALELPGVQREAGDAHRSRWGGRGPERRSGRQSASPLGRPASDGTALANAASYEKAS